MCSIRECSGTGPVISAVGMYLRGFKSLGGGVRVSVDTYKRLCVDIDEAATGRMGRCEMKGYVGVASFIKGLRCSATCEFPRGVQGWHLASDIATTGARHA